MIDNKILEKFGVVSPVLCEKISKQIGDKETFMKWVWSEQGIIELCIDFEVYYYSLINEEIITDHTKITPAYQISDLLALFPKEIKILGELFVFNIADLDNGLQPYYYNYKQAPQNSEIFCKTLSKEISFPDKLAEFWLSIKDKKII